MAWTPEAQNCGVHLQLLGRWQLSTIDGDERIPVDRTGQRLLALLALRGTLSRPHIWALLWPDVPTTRASGRLRTAVWRLAAHRLPLLAANSGQMSLPPTMRVDVGELYSAAASLDNAGYRCAGHTDISLFNADLLPDWDEDWLVNERLRIRQLCLHSLEALSAQLLQERRFGAAADAALAAVAIDPLRESAQSALICVHLAQGNAAEALRQFGICKALYAQELGMVPSPALFALVAHLTSGTQRPH